MELFRGQKINKAWFLSVPYVQIDHSPSLAPVAWCITWYSDEIHKGPHATRCWLQMFCFSTAWKVFISALILQHVEVLISRWTLVFLIGQPYILQHWRRTLVFVCFCYSMGFSNRGKGLQYLFRNSVALHLRPNENQYQLTRIFFDWFTQFGNSTLALTLKRLRTPMEAPEVVGAVESDSNGRW